MSGFSFCFKYFLLLTTAVLLFVFLFYCVLATLAVKNSFFSLAVSAFDWRQYHANGQTVYVLK